MESCPICGKQPLTVNENGLAWPSKIKYYSCRNNCIPVEEFYTRTAWNNMAKRESTLRSQLADAQAEVATLKGQLEEAGKALSGLGYTPSADDSGSYDSLIPDEYL